MTHIIQQQLLPPPLLLNLSYNFSLAYAFLPASPFLPSPPLFCWQDERKKPSAASPFFFSFFFFFSRQNRPVATTDIHWLSWLGNILALQEAKADTRFFLKSITGFSFFYLGSPFLFFGFRKIENLTLFSLCPFRISVAESPFLFLLFVDIKAVSLFLVGNPLEYIS